MKDASRVLDFPPIAEDNYRHLGNACFSSDYHDCLLSLNFIAHLWKNKIVGLQSEVNFDNIVVPTGRTTRRAMKTHNISIFDESLLGITSAIPRKAPEQPISSTARTLTPPPTSPRKVDVSAESVGSSMNSPASRHQAKRRADDKGSGTAIAGPQPGQDQEAIPARRSSKSPSRQATSQGSGAAVVGPQSSQEHHQSVPPVHVDLSGLEACELDWISDCRPEIKELFKYPQRALAIPPHAEEKYPNCPSSNRAKIMIKKIATHELYRNDARFLIEYANLNHIPSWIHWITLRDIIRGNKSATKKLSDYLLHVLECRPKRFFRLKSLDEDIANCLSPEAMQAYLQSQEGKRAQVSGQEI